ncbi:hypothetical protein DL89DRAFT_324352 [Linderina pennispora]|uniref:RRM domain-containing protein n=1 Tax=Linderina pennispora TaxID=61395 RepID=A0A1Y1W247_9FUNG|nr:uncharacterized protein DL89DRAFT_324352 [Linderina pennispora]ORX67601.1 hypothetical protein DL89DRAFT_324352 [Linderina pennispora]
MLDLDSMILVADLIRIWDRNLVELSPHSCQLEFGKLEGMPPNLSPLKQPDAPVALNLNDPAPMPQQFPQSRSRGQSQSEAQNAQWQAGWDQMHRRVLYFQGVNEQSLPELQQLFKSSRGIRLNVDPHESDSITGNVEFRNIDDTEKAMAVLNRRKLQNSNGTLMMSPLHGSELAYPPQAGYVCIKHIPEDATELTLYDFLRPVGPLYACSIPVHANGLKKDFAMACYIDSTDANMAVEQLNYADFLGNTVLVQPARAPRSSRASMSPSEFVPKPVSPVRSSAELPMPQIPTTPTGMHPKRAGSPVVNEGPGNGLGGVIVPGKLFITNLHPTVSHKELFALFKTYGYIQSARVSIDPVTKKSRGHGIVQFSDPTAALQALRECQGTDIKGRKITLYQYEHVNKNGQPVANATSRADSRIASHTPPTNPALRASASPPPIQPPIQPPRAKSQSPQLSSRSATATSDNDPLLDPIMLRNLTENARNEILTQKLISEVASNPAVDVRDSARVVESLLRRPVEEVVALIRDPERLATEWEVEQHTVARKEQLKLTADKEPAATITSQMQRVVLAEYPAPKPSPPVTAPAPVQPERQGASTGLHLQDYSTEVEEYIEMLLSKPDQERKKKLGSKLFPLIKGMGYKDSTKLTVWILEHMSQDVRALSYTMNDPVRLRDVVDEAKRSIDASR